MQSDPGAGVPHTGGNDDAVWRDLVARLQEPDDEFLNAPEPAQDGGSVDDSGDDRIAAGPVAAGSTPGEPKTVTDFDPLGVWQQQSQPAPRESVQPAQGQDSTAGPRDYVAEDDDGDFVPAELPSLSHADPAIMASWIGAAGGPLFLVFSAIFWRQIPLLMVFAVILAFLAGTGYLLFRLPNNRDHDSGDGAVL